MVHDFYRWPGSLALILYGLSPPLLGADDTLFVGLTEASAEQFVAATLAANPALPALDVPTDLPGPEALPSAEALRRGALARRPELLALGPGWRRKARALIWPGATSIPTSMSARVMTPSGIAMSNALPSVSASMYRSIRRNGKRRSMQHGPDPGTSGADRTRPAWLLSRLQCNGRLHDVLGRDEQG